MESVESVHARKSQSDNLVFYHSSGSWAVCYKGLQLCSDNMERAADWLLSGKADALIAGTKGGVEAINAAVELSIQESVDFEEAAAEAKVLAEAMAMSMVVSAEEEAAKAEEEAAKKAEAAKAAEKEREQKEAEEKVNAEPVVPPMPEQEPNAGFGRGSAGLALTAETVSLLRCLCKEGSRWAPIVTARLRHVISTHGTLGEGRGRVIDVVKHGYAGDGGDGGYDAMVQMAGCLAVLGGFNENVHVGGRVVSFHAGDEQTQCGGVVERFFYSSSSGGLSVRFDGDTEATKTTMDQGNVWPVDEIPPLLDALLGLSGGASGDAGDVVLSFFKLVLDSATLGAASEMAVMASRAASSSDAGGGGGEAKSKDMEGAEGTEGAGTVYRRQWLDQLRSMAVRALLAAVRAQERSVAVCALVGGLLPRLLGFALNASPLSSLDGLTDMAEQERMILERLGEMAEGLCPVDPAVPDRYGKA